MPLPTRADVVAYLRLNPALSTGEPSDPALAAEATFLDRLLAEAAALVERRVGVPIVAAERVMTVRAARRLTSPSGAFWDTYETATMFLPLYPVQDTPAPVVVDADGATVEATRYTVDAATGVLDGADGAGAALTPGTYTVTATVGLSAAPDYATAIEPVLSGIILDVVADRYQHREPGFSSVSEGSLARTHYATGLPPRAEAALKSFARVRV